MAVLLGGKSPPGPGAILSGRGPLAFSQTHWRHSCPLLRPAGQLPRLGPLPRRADEADAVLLPGPQGQPEGGLGDSGRAPEQGGWQQGGPSLRLPTPLSPLLFPAPQSSVVALPLNLAGAACAPDAEYTKKTNCFRLQ